ncbi:hypothetical protein E3J49_02075 [Candidatus Bathyarchaeota archaeon]|nr:MAG: hypothetical protein E3J49_02075 [Candidatus Bathyarchaeota archaeon]
MSDNLSTTYEANERKTVFLSRVALSVILCGYIVAFFGSFAAAEPHYRLTAILEANPSRYLIYIRNTLLFLVLPMAVVLVLTLIVYVGRRESLTCILNLWPILLVLGSISSWYGLLGIRWVNSNYSDAISWLKSCGNYTVEIDNLILAVYRTVTVGNILLVITGILHLLAPAFKRLSKT